MGHIVVAFGAVALIITVSAPQASAGRAQVKHPVFDPGVTASNRASLERQLEPLLELSDEELAALVPERNGFQFCECPNCDAGTQAGQMQWMGLEAPDKVKCKFCGMVFPNGQYPENRSITTFNPRAERVTYHYYEDDQARYYFSGRARYEAKHWLGGRALRLAQLAYLSKHPLHERKAIVLLDAFGQNYPGWCVVTDRAFGESRPLNSYLAKPHPYWGGIWSRWFYGDIPRDLILAYDLLHDSDQWEKLSAEKGLDVRKRLEDEVFHASVKFVRGYRERLGNMSPHIYRGLIVAGRVLAEPDYVHDAVDRFIRLVRTCFSFDGMWREGSISYHRQTLGGLRGVMALAQGYSDPAGYTWPKDGSHFDNLDLAAQFPFVTKVMQADSALVFPNGRIVPVHDAWARNTWKAALPPQTRLLAGMEHCCLHRGEGEHQMQAHLHFSGGYGHQHADNLSMILWACDRELLSDIGYTHTAYRRWATSTPSHNTVVVNEANQEAEWERCDLLLFDTGAGPLQTVEATAVASYPDVTRVYRRQLLLIDVSPTQAYVVDIFRVAGGTQHDWFLHGSADYDQSAATSLELTPVAGTLLGPDVAFRLPRSESDPGNAGDRNIAYAFIRDMAQARTDDQWTVTFAFAQDSPVQVRTTVLGQPGTTVVLGRCPSVRRADEDDSKLDDFLMPVVVARRSGEDLASTFVAVHEPFSDEPFIKSVRLLAPIGGAMDTVAVGIERQGERDVIICSTEASARELIALPGAAGTQCAGRTAFLRLRGGEVASAYLLDGTRLHCGSFRLEAEPAPEGVIERLVRDNGRFAFRVGERLPRGSALAGRTVLVTHPDGTRHGYGIRGAEGGSLILLEDDPGFTIRDDGKTEFLYFPHGEFEGPNTYRVLTAATWAPDRR